MTHEFSLMAVIAAAIIAASAVLGVLFRGAGQSREIAAAGFTAIMETHKVSKLETVQAFMERQASGMPASACYNLIKSNPELFTRITCNVCGKTTFGMEAGDCLENHITGRVRLILAEEESGGVYTAVIYSG